MMPFVTGALTGAAFGVVLYKVGASRYSRVMGMVTLRDTKIMKFAFTAIATASMLYGLAAVLGKAEAWNLMPRVMPFMGLAHLVGGVLFGAAMGVSGLCPGTCVAKAGGRGGDKKFAAPFAVVGLVAGVLAYALLKEPLTQAGVIAAHQKPLTVYGMAGLPYGPLALAFGALMLTIAIVADRVMGEKSYAPAHEKTSLLDWMRGEWSWTAAGTIAGVLVVVATAQGGYLGFSGALLAVVGWAAHLIGHPLDMVPTINDDIIWRAALLIGVFPGGVLAKLFSMPSKAAVAHPVVKVLDVPMLAKTFSATTVMSLGAMIGGGCTTGAFISGWSTLSVGSFAMGGTFFAAAIAMSQARVFLFRSLDLNKSQELGDRVYD